MKFWQYAVGGMSALLIFAAVIIGDNMQFSERSTFSQNPFLLMGTSRASFGGEIEFLPSGEMFWVDEDSETIGTDRERRLIQGIAAVGGTFFQTPEDSALTNKLWFGNAELHFEGATALVQMDIDGKATVLSGGGSVELFFDGERNSFILPAHSRITFDTKKPIVFDPYEEYYDLQKKFALESITTGKLVTKLWQAEQALAEWRSQFGHFAWNLPILWDSESGAFLQFLESITLGLPPAKRADRIFQESTQLLRNAHGKIDEPEVENILKEFREKVLDKPSWKSVATESDRFHKEWLWFEFAQKIWLPVVSPEASQQKFSALWSKDRNVLREQMRAAMLLSHNERWFRTEEQLSKFIKEFKSTAFTEEDLVQITRLRREMTGLLDAFPDYQSLPKIKTWTTIVREEQKYLSSRVQERFSEEIAHAIVRFVSKFIVKESGVDITKELNGLWFELKLSENKELVFSEAELTTIEQINLIGVSGMTPEQAQKALDQKQAQELIDAQLAELTSKEGEEKEEKKVIVGIANAKKLWEFLASKKIKLDITAFRTKRTETSLATRFANTETGKRKIEGVFDYHAQQFITLTLGEETIARLSAHRLEHWIKTIGGKFESEEEEEVKKEINEILQTTPQAVLGKKLVQELLRSFSVQVKRSQLEMKDKAYQRCAISRASYKGAFIDAEYNLLTQSFSRISVQKGEQFVSTSGMVSSDKFVLKLNALLATITDKD